MQRYIIAPILLALLFINIPVHAGLAGFTDGKPENVVFAQLRDQGQLLQLKKPILQPKKRPDIKPLPNTAGQTPTVPQQPEQTQTVSQPQDQSQFISQPQDQSQFVPQDPAQFTQSWPEQSQQGQPAYPSPGVQGTTGGSQGFAPATTDMQRRTGGQSRTNAPGMQQQPMGQQPMMQGPQQMPMGQQPIMQGPQGMPMQQDPSSMQMQQPGGGQQMMQQGGQGGCKVQLSEDRTTIALIDASGQEAEHVSLGQDRVQKVFKSPDGSWNVVVFKVRQRQEFGAIAINMMECNAQEARDIRAVPAQIEFQDQEMVLIYSGNASERFALSNKNLP